MTGPEALLDAVTVHLLDGEAVVWDGRTESLHHLDRVTTAIWARLDGRPLDEVVAELAADFGVPVAQVAADVPPMVERLVGLGLVSG